MGDKELAAASGDTPGPFLSSLQTLAFLRLISEPVSRGARGSLPAGVPGRPEPLPQLSEMPKPGLGEPHSPHLPQPQVVGLIPWASLEDPLSLPSGPPSPHWRPGAICLAWGVSLLPFSRPQPEPAVVVAALHLPAAPASAYRQQQQARSPASRHQHLRKPAAACEDRAREGLLTQGPGTLGRDWLEKGRRHLREKACMKGK